MHLLYRSTSFCIPAEKTLFGCSRSQVCTASLTSSLEVNLRPRNASFRGPTHKPFVDSWYSLHTEPTYDGEFPQFHSFCPKKLHYATFFFDGAILQRNVHVFALVAATRLKVERCTANDWTLQQTLSVLCNAPAPLCPGYHVI